VLLSVACKTNTAYLSGVSVWPGSFVGNCDIDFFIFRHHFCITRPKFLKFERDQNAAEKGVLCADSKNVLKHGVYVSS
jgi:hypothetical protein